MEVLKNRYTITELSNHLNLTTHTLRYYEKEFCIRVPKDERGRRYYTPELANLMYQIKRLREEGLEIKAIKKVLQSEIRNLEPPPVVVDVQTLPGEAGDFSAAAVREYLQELGSMIKEDVAREVNSSKEYIARELQKAKLELGACVENSARKLDIKMERHFAEVDRLISNWREKNKGGFLKRIFK